MSILLREEIKRLNGQIKVLDDAGVKMFKGEKLLAEMVKDLDSHLRLSKEVKKGKK